MKHQGKAAKAARRILLVGLVLELLLITGLLLAHVVPMLALFAVSTLFLFFVAFTLYFFRDPDAQVPTGPGLIVAPAHGLVDVVEEFDEPKVMAGRCWRVSIFLSVFDVHVQQAPVSGQVCFRQHTPGKYLNALKSDCAFHNENVLLGFETTEPAVGRVGVRLIAGLIARRIIPWVEMGGAVQKGERIALIQFGSRADVYLPLRAKVTVKPGDRVVGGETVIAKV